MKHNLKDTTFLIPLHIDSVSRLENLFMTVDFLQSNFECSIHILEAGRYNNGIVERCTRQINYCFIEDKDTVFHRTKYLNLMAKRVSTPYLAIWDSDIIIPGKQIIDAVTHLRSHNAQVAYPYDGRVLDTSFLLRQHYAENKDCSFLIRNQSKMKLLHKNYKVVGGAIFVNTNDYIKSGLENEHFYGWGAEDDERFARWEILGYKIYRSEGVLFHLSHVRSENSAYLSPFQKQLAYAELANTNESSKNDIEVKIRKGYFSIL